jgi:hypothetical protein
MRLSDPVGGGRAANRFRASLSKLSVRGAQALQMTLVAGLRRRECAEFFGISKSSFDVMFLRAARELRTQLEPGVETPVPSSYRDELEQAGLLAGSLENEAALAGELGGLLSLLQQVQSVAGEIRAQDEAVLREEQTSPRRRRKNLIWRVLLLAIVAASLFLYLRPRDPPRVISRVPPEQLR